MLRYFSKVWLNGIRNQTVTFVMVLLIDLLGAESRQMHSNA